jgi:hemerythrin superfamily protein
VRGLNSEDVKMTYEKETLKFLRQTLDQEEDETSIIPILENHHKYLKEYVNVLSNTSATKLEKQDITSIFFTIFEMHTRAEEKSLYKKLELFPNQDVRLEGSRNFDDHIVAHEIISELKGMGCTHNWSDTIEAKMNVLTKLIANHLKGEENVMFPMTVKYIPEEQLMDLAEDYLQDCRIYLDTQMRDFPSEVSRSDVMAFFY